ncbi:hypothetical protein EDC96DRAFT_530922 [Choanephora cucurbitarum]|nr:hypothetical protein EDC96DRAFT_530922 [Choanephora cucurbitarum]
MKDNLKALNEKYKVALNHKLRWVYCCIRVWQLIAAIGAFGFQIGATAYANEPSPFERQDLLYLGYVLSWFSIIWSLVQGMFYAVRRCSQGPSIKMPLIILFDMTLAALLGICSCYEITNYRCKLGLHHGWCDFYNTGLFFLMSLFVSYTIHTGWNLFLCLC